MGRVSEDDILSRLNKYFGYKALRPGQLAIMQKVFERRDVLVCKESGFGRTLCYQLPGLMRDGVVLVVSSIRSRVEEKCTDLADFNVKCAYLSSSAKSKSYNDEQDLRSLLMKKNKILDDLRNFAATGFKFLYVTHEYYANSSRLQQIVKDIYKKNLLQAVVLDDVHCTANFRTVFRKDYSILGKLRDSCPNAAFLCFVKPISANGIAIIRDTLNLKQPFVLNEPLVKENMSYKVMYTPEKYYSSQLVDFIKDTFPEKTGIVYCRNRDDCLLVCERLKEANVRNLYYHAHLSDDDKNWLHQWIGSEQIVVTCVTGSEVDMHLPSASYVVHATLPASLDVYMQETSKVARSADSVCVLFYNTADAKANLQQLAETYREKSKRASRESKRTYRSEFQEQAKLVTEAATYAENSCACRQIFLLSRGLSEDNVASTPCGVCDVCEVMKGSLVVDVGHCLRKILMAVWAINVRQSGFEKDGDAFYDVDTDDLVDLLTGSARKRLAASFLPSEWFFASFSSWDRELLQRLVFLLLGNKLVALNHAFSDKFESKARNLVITPKGQEFVKSTTEYNIPFSRKDVALTKWLSVEKITSQYKRDLENVVLYYSLHQGKHFFDNVSFVCDLLEDCPGSWEDYKTMKSKYTTSDKCPFDEDLFTVCLMYYQVMKKIIKVSHGSNEISRSQLEESHYRLFRRF
ncbi:putative ATP-dependent DNA helicase Q1 [Copidosoma floridanum]|uniref:putative ATP-dependent DNA helicase Q1 n=1 Tax=Copidosoma floridanum TaxID=29053 RepID=UPI0006C971B1|nr:putative ATP-dependent DNA helicase Q1 [Copidosoma floridanum]